MVILGNELHPTGMLSTHLVMLVIRFVRLHSYHFQLPDILEDAVVAWHG
jgi:hypothetical protein